MAMGLSKSASEVVLAASPQRHRNSASAKTAESLRPRRPAPSRSSSQLVPSLGPSAATPRTGYPELQGCLETAPIRAPRVLLPSRSEENDFARQKNCGRTLHRPASAPQLLGRRTEKKVLSAKTARGLRGMVKRATVVSVAVPKPIQQSPPEAPETTAADLDTFVTEPDTFVNAEPAAAEKPAETLEASELSAVRRLQRSSSAPMSRPSSAPGAVQRHVSFAEDDLLSSSTYLKYPERRESGLRSKRLRESLYELRRVGRRASLAADASSLMLATAEDQDNCVAPEAALAQEADLPQEEEPLDEPILIATLKDLQDSEASLLNLFDHLEAAQIPVWQNGGLRHPTCVIAARAQAVVQRKSLLLALVEQRTNTFREAHERREELLSGLVEKADMPLPQEMQGVRGFLAKQLHGGRAALPGGGHAEEPWEADRGDFEAFQVSFGLPRRHEAVHGLWDLASQASEWWMQTTLRQAQAESTDADVIVRLIEFSEGILGIKEHSALRETRKILADRLAWKVYRGAEESVHRDQRTQDCSARPLPSSAKQAAGEIGAAIRRANLLGVPLKHMAIEEAKMLQTRLQKEERRRYGLIALRFAEQAFARDEIAAQAWEGTDAMPEVGLASAAADAIEKEIKAAVALGALEASQELKSAVDIAKSLRDKDGFRKRIAGRLKRLLSATS